MGEKVGTAKGKVSNGGCGRNHRRVGAGVVGKAAQRQEVQQQGKKACLKCQNG